MIHVQRTGIPPALDGKDSPGGKERRRWELYHQGQLKRKPGDFSAYNDTTVKMALIEMFHRKCAYCDSTTPIGDVEHWRPKNAVADENRNKLSDGYWWLAAEWENLLYSCPACNQIRYRELANLPGLSRAGKGTQFPLSNEARRARKKGQEIKEEPLLLNPCLDNPEHHLVVGLAGLEAGVLQPVLDPANQPDQRALTTISIFGLNDITKVRRRERLLRFIRNRQEDINSILADLPDDSTSPRYLELIDKFQVKITELKEYLSEDQEDMLLIRQVLVPYLQSLGIRIP